MPLPWECMRISLATGIDVYSMNVSKPSGEMLLRVAIYIKTLYGKGHAAVSRQKPEVSRKVKYPPVFPSLHSPLLTLDVSSRPLGDCEVIEDMYQLHTSFI